MKLLNKSLIYLSLSLIVILGVWAMVFYYNMLREIKASVDEGMDNYKRQIVFQAQSDSTILTHNGFDVSFFEIHEIDALAALQIKDTYVDTAIYMQDADDLKPEKEPVRMLVTAFEENGKYYQLRIVNSMVEEDDLVIELLKDVLWLYVAFLLCLILIYNMVLKKLWKPFYKTLQELKNYRVGKTTILSQVKQNTKEFQDLNLTVNALLEHVNHTFEAQKQFIGNASHELQTPLAVAISKMELLLEKNELTEEQSQSLVEIMEIIERLVRLNKSLLHLTKIENKQFFDNKIINMREVVVQNLHDLEDLGSFKELKMDIKEIADLWVNMDESLAQTIVSNLMRNAIFHSPVKSTIQINVDSTFFQISNEAKHGALDLQKIYSRFYKSDENASSTGLGLAIVKAICDLYGFQIRYDFQENNHVFTVFMKK